MSTRLLSDLVISAAGALTATRVFSTMASALENDVTNADPEIATLITDYVAVIVDLWRAAGLRPGRAHDTANPERLSRPHYIKTFRIGR